MERYFHEAKHGTVGGGTNEHHRQGDGPLGRPRSGSCSQGRAGCTPRRDLTPRSFEMLGVEPMKWKLT